MSREPSTIPSNPPLDFPPGTRRILDIGCGDGRFFSSLKDQGCEVVGVDANPADVAKCCAAGFDVREGKAEHLPVPDASCEGIVCNVVLPYTDERRAVQEWARVLVPGGMIKASYQGPGYPLQQLVEGPGFKVRFYGLRTLINGWWYAVTGNRLMGWLGDTLFQSRARLNRYYAANGLEVTREITNGRCCGWPIFVYHELRKGV